MKILRMPAVLEETGHRSQASIYNAIRVGLFWSASTNLAKRVASRRNVTQTLVVVGC